MIFYSLTQFSLLQKDDCSVAFLRGQLEIEKYRTQAKLL